MHVHCSCNVVYSIVAVRSATEVSAYFPSPSSNMKEYLKDERLQILARTRAA